MSNIDNHRPIPTERLQVLDGLRAIAILLILSLHITDNLYMTARPFEPLGSQSFTWFLMNGWVGVHLFFVLSGFLITGQLLKIGAAPNQNRILIGKFYKRRIFRIVPAYYFVLFLIFSSIFVINFPLSPEGTQHFIEEVFAYFTFISDTYTSRLGIGYVFWSLSTEFKFYLLAPLLVFTLSQISMNARYLILSLMLFMLLALKVGILTIGAAAENPLQFFMNFRRPFYMAIDSLIAGMICQYMWADVRLHRFIMNKNISSCLFYSGLILILYLMSFLPPYWLDEGQGLSTFNHTANFSLIALAFSLILLGLLGHPYGYRFFEMPIFKYIALISYSLYLLHTFLVPFSISISREILGPATSSFLIWGSSFFILTVTSSIPAFLTYYFIERPCIIWSKKERIKLEQ